MNYCYNCCCCGGDGVTVGTICPKILLLKIAQNGGNFNWQTFIFLDWTTITHFSYISHFTCSFDCYDQISVFVNFKICWHDVISPPKIIKIKIKKRHDLLLCHVLLRCQVSFWLDGNCKSLMWLSNFRAIFAHRVLSLARLLSKQNIIALYITYNFETRS